MEWFLDLNSNIVFQAARGGKAVQPFARQPTEGVYRHLSHVQTVYRHNAQTWDGYAVYK